MLSQDVETSSLVILLLCCYVIFTALHVVKVHQHILSLLNAAHCLIKGLKDCVALWETQSRATERHLPYGFTQCDLPPQHR